MKAEDRNCIITMFFILLIVSFLLYFHSPENFSNKCPKGSFSYGNGPCPLGSSHNSWNSNTNVCCEYDGNNEKYEQY